MPTHKRGHPDGTRCTCKSKDRRSKITCRDRCSRTSCSARRREVLRLSSHHRGSNRTGRGVQRPRTSSQTPANIIGIRACQALMPNVPMVGVFDTAFHQTMPEKAYLYGLPYEYYEKYKVRRYGFHGTSHSFCIKGGSKLPWNGLKQLKDYRSTPWKRSFSQRSIKR